MKRAPRVVKEAQSKLKKRIEDLMGSHGGVLQPKDLEREIAIFADRSDITEEVTRLRSHLTEFNRILTKSKEAGRRLDFLLQEMNREVNTMGAKASDSQISHMVVDVKGELERMREQVQNIE